MKKAFILFTFCSLIWACRQKPKPHSNIWTKKYEQNFYNNLDSTTKSTIPDPVKRAKFLTYIIMRFKQEIPNGLNSVSKDSLHNLSVRLGREYGIKEGEAGNTTKLVPHYKKWTPLFEKEFRDSYVAVFQGTAPGFGEKLCDCMMVRLKKIYPDSVLIPIPKDINLKIGLECTELIKKSKSI